jgi:hypothetical protein
VKLVVTCPSCGGTYGAARTHAHTRQNVIDERFAGCHTCNGIGAVTCATCDGIGRVYMENGRATGPARDETIALAQSRNYGAQPKPPRKAR